VWGGLFGLGGSGEVGCGGYVRLGTAGRYNHQQSSEYNIFKAARRPISQNKFIKALMIRRRMSHRHRHRHRHRHKHEQTSTWAGKCTSPTTRPTTSPSTSPKHGGFKAARKWRSGMLQSYLHICRVARGGRVPKADSVLGCEAGPGPGWGGLDAITQGHDGGAADMAQSTTGRRNI